MMFPSATTSWLRSLSLLTLTERGEPVWLGSTLSVVGVPLRDTAPVPVPLTFEADDEEDKVDVLEAEVEVGVVEVGVGVEVGVVDVVGGTHWEVLVGGVQVEVG